MLIYFELFTKCLQNHCNQFCRVRVQQRGLHLRIHPISLPNFLCMLLKIVFQGHLNSPTVCEETCLFSVRICSILTASCEYSSCTLVLVHDKLLILLQVSSAWVLSMMKVFQNVHATNGNQKNAVARSIESPHEDLHEVTSISSYVDLNSQSVSACSVSQGMDLCLDSYQQPRQVLINETFP